MPEPTLRFLVRTPHTEVLQREVSSLRVPTETGWVGLLPGAERSVLVIEPGLVVVRSGSTTSLVGTAGGVLRVERDTVTLLASVAVAGEDAQAVREALDTLAGEPSAEVELRRRIEALERGLLAESRTRARGKTRLPQEER
jgi:F0F1-type ATP synthase epsilon subunit